jgi:D-amino-acid dehydrogenase
MEISGLKSPMLIKRAHAIFDAAKYYYPSLPVSFPEENKIWFGYRPLSPDGLPYLGRHTSLTNAIMVGGHAMLGISLAAATGKLVGELIDNAPTSMNIKPFDIER